MSNARTGICPICGRRVPVGARNRVLAHNIHLRGLWGRTILDKSCAGRGHAAASISDLPADPIEPVQLPVVLER